MTDALDDGCSCHPSHRAVPNDYLEATPRQITLLSLVLEGALAALAVALGWLLRVDPLGSIEWRNVDFLLGAQWGLGLAVVVLAIAELPRGPLASLRELVESRLVPLFAGCPWFLVAFIAASAGIGEELFFRGFLQAKIESWWGPSAAIAAASAFFGLAHALSFAYFATTFLMGIVLGGLFVWYENLLVPIVAHAVYDFAAIYYLVRKSSRRLLL